MDKVLHTNTSTPGSAGSTVILNWNASYFGESTNRKFRITIPSGNTMSYSGSTYHEGMYTFTQRQYSTSMSVNMGGTGQYTIEALGTEYGPISAGLPNILGYGVSTDLAYTPNVNAVDGAIYNSANGIQDGDTGRGYTNKGSCTWAYWGIDASLSNAIYGSSTTVTPASLAVGFYIRY